MTMKVRSTLWTVVLCLCFACFESGDADASRNTVISIDPAGVERLAQKKDCPVIISVITSRCGACRKELPLYQEVYEKYRNQGFAVFVISIDFGTAGEIQNLVDRMGLTMPVYWGGEQVMRAFDVSLVPYKIIVVNGTVVEKIVGAWIGSEMEDTIQKLMAECRR